MPCRQYYHRQHRGGVEEFTDGNVVPIFGKTLELWGSRHVPVIDVKLTIADSYPRGSKAGATFGGSVGDLNDSFSCAVPEERAMGRCNEG